MPPRDIEDPVFAIGADRHRKLVAIVRDLLLVEGRLRREHIVKGRQGKAAAGPQIDAEILPLAVGGADQPENHLAFEEFGPVLLQLVAHGQQLQNVDRAWPILVADDGRLIFARRGNSERLAAILLPETQKHFFSPFSP